MHPWITKEYGREYYYHPFLDSLSFFSPDRITQPFIDDTIGKELPIHCLPSQEQYCDFCIGRTPYSTPEKTILIKKSDTTKYIHYPSFQQITENEIFLRRQGNLFEIVPYSFWQEKYNIPVPREAKERILNAFQNKQEKKSLEFLLSLKYKKTISPISSYPTLEQKIIDCLPFYVGFHELLTAGRHYQKNATHSHELFHSGKITWTEHRLIFEMINLITEDMLNKNPFIQYITIFQNWLTKSGASFEHWHKQILGIDFWGIPLEREAQLFYKNPSVYKEFIISIGTQEELFIAENKHAIAYIETGTKSGQIVICSKSHNIRPLEHTLEEQHSMSDLLHAIYTSFPTLTPYNEEWIYTPYGQDTFKTPWRIIINIRTNINAGFENITQHLISSMSIKEYACLIRGRLEKNLSLIAPDINICHSLPISPIFNYI